MSLVFQCNAVDDRHRTKRLVLIISLDSFFIGGWGSYENGSKLPFFHPKEGNRRKGMKYG